MNYREKTDIGKRLLTLCKYMYHAHVKAGTSLILIGIMDSDRQLNHTDWKWECIRNLNDFYGFDQLMSEYTQKGSSGVYSIYGEMHYDYEKHRIEFDIHKNDGTPRGIQRPMITDESSSDK